MKPTKNIIGLNKKFFNFRLKLRVFLHFLPELLKGNIGPGKFSRFLRRLLYFISKMQHNKFVRMGRKTRIDLYVPGYPSKAFYTACGKFKVFGEKLPCTTVLISITSACRFKCKHCYQKHDKGKDVEIKNLVSVIKTMQNRGIAFFNIEGGEPFLVYDRLKRVCEAIDNRSEIWVNSTGDGITPERLAELKKLGLTALMFSLHSPEPDEFNSFLGSEHAWDIMAKGIETCHSAKVPVALNSCLMKESFHNGAFEKLMDRAREFSVAILQLIKPKPAGGWLAAGIEQFSEKDTERVKELVNMYNADPAYIDFPAISAQIIEEDKTVFGCTAGGTDRFYINAKGDVQPCEFLNFSFGNITSDDFEKIYGKMRTTFERPGCSWLCEQCSGEILRIFKENDLRSLPLPPDLSRQIYESWDRGDATELYRRLEGY